MDIIAFLGRSRATPEFAIETKIANVIGSTNETLSLWVEPVSKPIFFAMEQFCKGTHHAFAVDLRSEGHVVKMLSQSDIVHYLLRHRHSFPGIHDFFQKPIGVISMQATAYAVETTSIVDVLEMCVVHHAVPILDRFFNVIAVFSASDLKGHLNAVVAFDAPMTVMEFITYRNDGAVRSPLTVTPECTLQEAAEAMYSRGFHRVFIQPRSPDYLPQVASYTDIIKSIFLDERSHELEASRASKGVMQSAPMDVVS